MNLDPSESELVGNWIVKGQTVHADDVTERIQSLTKNVLEKVAFSRESGAWEPFSATRLMVVCGNELILRARGTAVAQTARF